MPAPTMPHSWPRRRANPASAAVLIGLALPQPSRAADDDEEPDYEIVVQEESEASELQRSSEAVQVVDTAAAQLESADLGEVVARTSGVAVQRTGGLGSSQRFSLNGLTDNQVRFFLDGIPLDFAGYPYGLANVPVAFVDRVEVYRGVVPIRFGSDALGGAVNLVGPELEPGTGGSASVQVGSFDTLRASGGLHHHFGASGLYLRASTYLDYAKNDYPVQVDVPDAQGRPVETSAYRFHDAYVARGGWIEVGLDDQSWADRLSLRVFASDFGREIQSNPSMTVPYGEVETADRALGGLLRYRGSLGPAWTLDAALGASRSASDFVDTGDCIYDWFGQCGRTRQDLGEIEEGQPLDQTLREHAGFGRFNARWAIAPIASAGLSIAPTWTFRTGEDHLNLADSWYSSVEAERRLLSLVAGSDARLELADGRLEWTPFAKAYLQDAQSEDPVYGLVERELDRQVFRLGAGQGLRWAFSDAVYAKASYEYATRLPEADEVFGDAQLVNENLAIEPEVSHNANLELTVEEVPSPAGAFRGSVNGFLRETRDQIVLLEAYGQRFRYENVYEARSAGAELELGYSTPGSWLDVEVNGTCVDLRNRSDEGPLGIFVGDRIPNRPYLFANAGLRLQKPDVFAAGDLVRLRWHTRYVHEFFQFWESAGTADSKRVVPSQLTHSLALSIALLGPAGRRLTMSGEVDNLTNARVYDLYGAQRPGRAVYFKTTVEL